MRGTLSMMLCSLTASLSLFFLVSIFLWKSEICSLICLTVPFTSQPKCSKVLSSEAFFNKRSLLERICYRNRNKEWSIIYELFSVSTMWFIANNVDGHGDNSQWWWWLLTFVLSSNSRSSLTRAWATSKDSPIPLCVSKNSSAYCSNHSRIWTHNKIMHCNIKKCLKFIEQDSISIHQETASTRPIFNLFVYSNNR